MRCPLPAIVLCFAVTLPPVAHGQEAVAPKRLVMPYACVLDGRKLSVRPSEDRAYEILGSHRQQSFTTCNSGGNRCTTLAIHRFSISCDGVSVPWMRIAERLRPGKSGRRWVEAGQLNIVRPAAGHIPMCSDGAAAQGSRECLPWAQRPAMERIVLPAGFAPLADAGARIEAVVPAAAQAVGPAQSAVAVPAQVAAAAAGEQAPRAVVPAPSAGPSAMPRPVTVAAPTVPAKPPAKGAEWVAVVEARDLSELPPTQTAGTSMLWAWLGGLAGLAALAALIARVPPETRARLAARLRGFGVRLRQNSVRLRKGSIRLRRIGISLSEASAGLWRAAAARLTSLKPAPRCEAAVPPQEVPGHAEDQALASAAWTAAALLEDIEQSVKGLGSSTPLRAVLEEELSSIHQRLVVTRAAALDGGAPAKAASQFRALVRELERVKRIASSAAASLSGSRPAAAVPATKSEAYQLLGVNPDVSEGILKKLVDALRMTWHPDHARDEQDRLLREDRIKQINIAWDLIRA